MKLRFLWNEPAVCKYMFTASSVSRGMVPHICYVSFVSPEWDGERIIILPLLVLSDASQTSGRVSVPHLCHVTWLKYLQVWTGQSGLWSGWASTWERRSTSSMRWGGTLYTVLVLPMDQCRHSNANNVILIGIKSQNISDEPSIRWAQCYRTTQTLGQKRRISSRFLLFGHFPAYYWVSDGSEVSMWI